MKKAKILLVVVPALVLVLGAVTSPVYARDGNDDTSDSSSSNTASQTENETEANNSSDTSVSEDNKVVATNDTETEHGTETRLRERGQELLQEARKEHKTQKQEDRQKACEAHKDGLQTKVDNLVSNAKKHKERIDSIYDKLVAYQKDKNLTVSNWDTLTSAADAAKAKAQTSVDALTSLKPTVDCNSTSVASDVATFKAAAQQARTDLHAYRTAVKNVLTALKSASQE